MFMVQGKRRILVNESHMKMSAEGRAMKKVAWRHRLEAFVRSVIQVSLDAVILEC